MVPDLIFKCLALGGCQGQQVSGHGLSQAPQDGVGLLACCLSLAESCENL